MTQSLLDELKTRIVIRAGMAYIAAAWVLLQVMDVVAEPLGMPDWSQTLLIAALAAGFPVVVIIGLVVDVRRKRKGVKAASLADDAQALAAQPQRLAVLPFTELGSDDDNYLGDGMAEEIISTVARYADITVIARASSFRFRGVDIDMAAVRDSLQATHLITGSVRRDGERMRISVQLVQLADESQLWSESFQRATDDVFAVQTDIARSVSKALVAAMGLEIVVKQREWDLAPAAYEQYLMAKAAFNREDFPKALEHASTSRQIDSENPLVSTLLAEICLYWTRYGVGVTKDQLLQARGSAEEALGVDPTHPSARAAQGMLGLYLERDFATAYTTVVNAAMEQPAVADWIPILLTYAGRVRDAIDIQRRIIARDPLNTFSLATMANRLNWVGKQHESMEIFNKVAELDPQNLIRSNMLFRAVLREEQFDKAKDMLRAWGMNPDEPTERPTRSWFPRSLSLWMGARLYGAMGEMARAKELAQEIEKEDGFTPTTVAEAYISAGAMDDAYRVFELGYERVDPGIYDLIRPLEMRDPDNPLWLKFAGDPRFQTMQAKLGIDAAALRDVDWSGLELVLD
ncbi:MAG: hypothetical protein AAGA84_08845 [Pseudomonadota bacterium]